MSARLTKRVALALALVFGAACSSDKATSPTATLSDAEFTAMLDAFTQVGATEFGSAPPPAGLRAAGRARLIARVTTVTTTIDTTIACSGGGTSRVQGTLTDASADGETFTTNGTATLSFAACKESASTGELFTFDANPPLTETLSATSGPTSGSFVVHLTGRLTWALNSKTGSCDFNVTVTESDDANSFTITTSGTVCGRPVPDSFAGG